MKKYIRKVTVLNQSDDEYRKGYYYALGEMMDNGYKPTKEEECFIEEYYRHYGDSTVAPEQEDTPF